MSLKIQGMDGVGVCQGGFQSGQLCFATEGAVAQEEVGVPRGWVFTGFQGNWVLIASIFTGFFFVQKEKQ